MIMLLGSKLAGRPAWTKEQKGEARGESYHDVWQVMTALNGKT